MDQNVNQDVNSIRNIQLLQYLVLNTIVLQLVVQVNIKKILMLEYNVYKLVQLIIFMILQRLLVMKDIVMQTVLMFQMLEVHYINKDNHVLLLVQKVHQTI